MASNMAPFTDVESNGKARSSLHKSRREQGLIAAVVVLAFIVFAFVIAVVVLALRRPEVIKTTPDTCEDVCTTSGCLSTAMDLFDSMDTTVDPCDNFYQFACGKWTSSGLGNNRMESAAIKNMFTSSDNINKAADDPSIPQSVKKIATAYKICRDFGELKETDIAWLLQSLNEVGGWPMIDKNWDGTRYHWEKNLAQAIHRLVIKTPIDVTVDVNFFNTKKHTILIQQHPLHEMEPLQKEKILSIARKIVGNRDNHSLEIQYKEVEDFYKTLTEMSRLHNDLLDDPSERRLLTITELDRSIPWINWLEFLRTILGPYLKAPLAESDSVILVGETYISKVLEEMFKEKVNKRIIANYIAASFIQSLIKVNSNAAVQKASLQTKDFSRSLARINVPQGFSESCINFYSLHASYAIDFIHHKYRKTEILGDEMFDIIFNTMKDGIKQVTWLDERTKSAAVEKLEAIVHFSGYPDIAKDSRKVEEYYRGLPNMTENGFRNQIAVLRHRLKKSAELLGENVDRNSWPTAVGAGGNMFNAFYAADTNSILVPAGIQISPIFAPERPKYWNYGSFGWILGHEVTHAFDTAGSKRDKFGNVKNWWMPKAKEEFNERSKCFIEQYNKIYFGYKGHHVNGTKTLAENVADNGGFHQSFLAYKRWEQLNGKEKRLPGLEKYDPYQLFYIAAAQPYCSMEIPPETLYTASIHDIHSPNRFRFQEAASNSEDFAKVFKCKPGSPMNPTKKCVIW